MYFQGWKLPDMMFATRRSLADAGKSFSKQIDGVFSSISVSFFFGCTLEIRTETSLLDHVD